MFSWILMFERLSENEKAVKDALRLVIELRKIGVGRARIAELKQ